MQEVILHLKTLQFFLIGKVKCIKLLSSQLNSVPPIKKQGGKGRNKKDAHIVMLFFVTWSIIYKRDNYIKSYIQIILTCGLFMAALIVFERVIQTVQKS